MMNTSKNLIHLDSFRQVNVFTLDATFDVIESAVKAAADKMGHLEFAQAVCGIPSQQENNKLAA